MEKNKIFKLVAVGILIMFLLTSAAHAGYKLNIFEKPTDPINKQKEVQLSSFFGNRAYLKDITHSNSSLVVNRRKLFKTIINIEKDIEINEGNNQQDIYDDLLFFNIVDKKHRKLHVSNIKKKFNK